MPRIQSFHIKLLLMVMPLVSFNSGNRRPSSLDIEKGKSDYWQSMVTKKQDKRINIERLIIYKDSIDYVNSLKCKN